MKDIHISQFLYPSIQQFVFVFRSCGAYNIVMLPHSYISCVCVCVCVCFTLLSKLSPQSLSVFSVGMRDMQACFFVKVHKVKVEQFARQLFSFFTLTFCSCNSDLDLIRLNHGTSFPYWGMWLHVGDPFETLKWGMPCELRCLCQFFLDNAEY